MKLLKNIIYNILSIQEKILKYQLSKTLGVKNHSNRKRHYINGCSIDLSTLADKEKMLLEKEITDILKDCDYSPEKILEYIKKEGCKIYYIKNASKILNPIGENEGFIYPASGAKALYLSLLLTSKFSLKLRKCLYYQKEILISIILSIIFITGLLLNII